MNTPRKKPIQHERILQIQAVDAIRRMFPNVICAHIPNGGKRGKAAAANLKRMGVLPGVPDLALWWDGGHGLIELKAGKGGLSEPQRLMLGLLATYGVRTSVCRSLDDVVRTLHGWGLR